MEILPLHSIPIGEMRDLGQSMKWIHAWYAFCKRSSIVFLVPLVQRLLSSLWSGSDPGIYR